MSKTVLYILIIAQSAFPHSGGNHVAKREQVGQTVAQRFKKIDQDYASSVRPIFEKKCVDCHGGPTRYPWYYSIPGAKQLIDSDIKEAKKHLDMSKGFPFEGHGTPKEDLEALEKVITERSMPPWRYWIINRKSRVSDEDEKAVLEWIRRSQSTLESDKK